VNLDLWQIAFGLLWPPVYALIWRAFGSRGAVKFWEHWFWGGVGVIVGSASVLDFPELAVGVVQLVFGAVMWWLSRRKRKRSAKLAGAKARALVASLVRSMRERAVPRPVLRPVPGGSGA
jgi:hypothetical protein